MLDGEPAVAPGFPRPTAQDWLVCRDAQPGSEGADGAAGAHARPGQRGHSRAEDGYQVCSCSSLAPRPLRASGRLLAAVLLLPPSVLWAVAQAPPL